MIFPLFYSETKEEAVKIPSQSQQRQLSYMTFELKEHQRQNSQENGSGKRLQ